jgi:ubiquinone/menaquinone biosynthesis C-methylase UbiE
MASHKNMASTLPRIFSIENVLAAHPGVSDAVVINTGTSISAYVVPNDDYLDNTLGRKEAETTALRTWRKTYDLTQFAKDAASAPVGFNTLGWNSTYTRQPIPAGEMREWLQTTIAEITALAPKTVYEIACGTGMLLMQIAPTCDRYVAIDFSRAVLQRLRKQLETVPAVAEHVEVIERTADDFTGIESNSFDIVIINSAAHYFPQVAYLTRVVENAVNIVKPGGHVFVGDVRSLPLLPAFASSVELFQSPDSRSIGELRELIEKRIQTEQQLVLSPAYFLSLQGRLPKVSRVEIRPRWGRMNNEMSLYRYDAILHVGDRTDVAQDIQFLDWTEGKLTLDDIRSMVLGQDGVIGIKRIRNARLEKDIRAFESLRTLAPAHTAGELRRECEHHSIRGIHPQDLADVFKPNSGFRVLLSWAASREDGSYDAVFIPAGNKHDRSCVVGNWPGPDAAHFVNLANSPGQTKIRTELLDRILTHCKESLPEHLTPGDFTFVEMLPKSEGGAIDPGDLPFTDR